MRTNSPPWSTAPPTPRHLTEGFTLSPRTKEGMENQGHTLQRKGENTAKASRADTPALFRFITGHAFTGEYTASFLSRKFPATILGSLTA